MNLARASALVLVLVSGCSTRPPENRAKRPGHCNVVATLTSVEPALLDVDEHCTGREFSGFTATEQESKSHIQVLRLDKAPNDAHVRYRVDLEAIAEQNKSFDLALRSGHTLVTTVSTWLLAPEPLGSDVRVELKVETGKDVQFSTGLRQTNGGFELFAHEIPVATYALFGRFDTRREHLKQSEVDLAIAEGPLDVPHTELAAWVTDCANAVAAFWRGFPVPRTLVTLIPAPGEDRIVFGKVLPESAPGVVVLVGEHVNHARLYDDWILVHELFHLGVPSFNGEGQWFDEGLATYFEPIIRARAGWRSEEEVWAEFSRAMPLGLGAVNRKGLEKAEDFAEIYWGGAIVVMLADLEMRRRSEGKIGLEDGLRGVLHAGGHASEVWPLGRVLALADKTSGVPALEPLARAHMNSPSRVDLDAVFRELGVERVGESVRLHADAPLAGVRHAIVFGKE